MKLILIAIFNIIIFNFISSKNLKTSDIFKGGEKNFNPKNKYFPIHCPQPLRDKNDFKVLSFPLKIRKRNFFLACCAISELTSIKQIKNAYDFALKNNFVINEERPKNCYEFAKKASKEFKTTYNDKSRIKGPSIYGSFRVINSNKKVIFDSSKISKIFTENEIRYLNTLFNKNKKI